MFANRSGSLSLGPPDAAPLYVGDFLSREEVERLVFTDKVRKDLIRYISRDGERARPFAAARRVNEAVAGPCFDEFDRDWPKSFSISVSARRPG
jgi:hypothetical protein